MATGETAVKSDSKPSVKKAAAPQAAGAKPAVKKAVAPKTTAKPAAKKAAASKTDVAAPPSASSPQPALNPSGDWPFPTGLRP